MNSQLEFLRLYKTRLQPALRSLEPKRKAALSAFILASALTVAGIPGVLLFFRAGKTAGLLWALVFIGFGIYQFVRYGQKKKEYASAFKEDVVRELVRLIDANLSYYPDFRIPRNEYQNSDLFRNRIDHYSGDDLVEGALGVTRCKFSELEHREKRESVDSRGRRQTHWVTIFKGIFFIADFNKHFHGRTYIVPDAGLSFFGLGKLFEDWSQGRGERVELENPEFEKLFTVYSSDQVEARYILSTSMMERLVNFRRKANTKMHLSFIDSNIYVALSINKNLFEPNLFSSGVKFSYLKNYFNNLELITGIVEELNLNVRVWGKD